MLWDDADRVNHPERNEKITLKPDAEIRRVVLCTGKVYYDLYEAREAAGIDDVYLLRVEQLYPFPARALIAELGRFPNAEVVWCQEEPRNMGAWTFIEPNIEWVLEHVDGKAPRASYAGRAASAADRDRPGEPALGRAEGAGGRRARRVKRQPTPQRRSLTMNSAQAARAK